MQTSIYRRRGSLLYWVHYQDERGISVDRCTGSSNLSQATRIAAELSGTTAEGPRHASQNQTKIVGNNVEASIAQFLEFCQLDKSDSTIKCYEQKAGHLVRLLGDLDLCAVKVDDVQKYCMSRLEEGAARESVRKELIVLRSTLSLARDRGMLIKDPDALIPKFRAPYRPKRRWLSDGEMVELLKNLPEERKVWVLLAVFTGARLSELESLTWGDLNFAMEQIHIRGTKTDRSDRFIPMDPELAKLLLPLRSDADQPVAGRWVNVRRDLRKACEKAHIDPVSPNDLRRTFASWLKQAGRDSLAVGRLLGHTSSRMVELVYGHLDQKSLQRAMEALPSLASLTGQNIPPERRN